MGQLGSTSSRLLLFTVLHVVVAAVFLRGFLLTRLELPDVAECSTGRCSSQPPYSKAVVLIVDAVRFDFLCGEDFAKSSSIGHHAGLMPKTLGLVQASNGSGVASRFVADTPTITMSRLKALLTGGLPTFLDVGQSFSASAVSEDNLLQQLVAQHKRLVMMGDDTWMQLAKDVFAEAYPYPSFNVHDLRTVDDGVWEHLMPLLARPDTWDVLIAHYLGVDHAGHTYGVSSRQMEAKLAQMDDQVSSVIESLASQAGPGSPYADTLLLVLSDHGQTLGGDHGGGTPDETDSILVAMSLKGMHQALHQQGTKHSGAATTGASSSSGSNEDSFTCSYLGGSEDGLLRLMRVAGYTGQLSSPAAPNPAADDGWAPCSQHSSNLIGSQQQHELLPASLSELVCGNTIPQIDLTPLLAYLLGVPIPFGSLGKLPPHLFKVLTAPGGKPAQGDAGVVQGTWLLEYAEALAENAAQVHSYLNRYAAVGGLPAGQLAAVNRLYTAVQQQQRQLLEQQTQQPGNLMVSDTSDSSSTSTKATTSTNQPAAHEQLEALVTAQLSYLTAAAELARRRFTLFQQVPMWTGCILGVLLLVLQLMYLLHVVSRLRRSTPCSYKANDHITIPAFAGLAAIHALGLFSVGLLMGEGRLQCVLLATLTLLLLRSALQAVLHARRLSLTPEVQPLMQPAADATTNGRASTNGVAEGGEAANGLSTGSSSAVYQAAPAGPASLPDINAWSSWGPCARAVGAACAMLICNGVLQLLGLIDRSGQDPHDKTQPSSELLVGPDATWQRAVFLAFTAGPLFVSWVLFARMSQLLLRHSGGRTADGASNSWAQLLKALCVVQYVSLAAFWVAQLFGFGDATLWSLHADLQLRLQNTWYAEWVNAVPPSGSVGRLVLLASGILHLPLRLLLPRGVYLIALAAVCVVALNALLPRWLALSVLHQGSGSMGHASKLPMGQSTGPPVAFASVLWLWMCAAVAAALVMVLGFKGPATMLLALLQAISIGKLLRLRGAAQAFVLQLQRLGGSEGSTTTNPAQDLSGSGESSPGLRFECLTDSQCQDAMPDDVSTVVGSGAWGMMSLQLFFCSGHFCEFSGLQYASAFIGFDSMVWYSSGSLLLLNTCGFLFWGCISLPIFLQACCIPEGIRPDFSANGLNCDGKGSAAGADPNPGPAQGLRRDAVGAMQLECGLLVINSMRFAALVVCMISAAVQQQHILLWAIFAPKLVFELWFMAVTDVTQLLTATLT